MPRFFVFILSCLFSLVLQGQALTYPVPAPDISADMGYSAYSASRNADRVQEAFTQSKREIANARNTANAAEVDKLEEALRQQAKRADVDWDALPNTVNRHPNWVEVINVRAKILARKAHVLFIENLSSTRKYNEQLLEGYTGGHTEQALKEYAAKHGGTCRIEGKPADLADDVAFEGQGIITINGKDYVKTNGKIVEYAPGKYAGTSTYFPENWDEARILDEVEYAIKNNHGKYAGGAANEYFGFSKDGKIEIHFYMTQDGIITSFFPNLK